MAAKEGSSTMKKPEQHHHRTDGAGDQAAVETGKIRGDDLETPVGDVDDYEWQPIWHFHRFMKLDTMVLVVAFFDALMYSVLCCVCSYLMIMWSITGTNPVAGNTKTYTGWECFMARNETGIWLLLMSYMTSCFAGWNLGLRLSLVRRWPGFWYLVTNLCSTCLVILAMVLFPFPANFGNVLLITIRIYQYWVVLFWDKHILAMRDKRQREECLRYANQIVKGTRKVQRRRHVPSSN